MFENQCEIVSFEEFLEEGKDFRLWDNISGSQFNSLGVEAWNAQKPISSATLLSQRPTPEDHRLWGMMPHRSHRPCKILSQMLLEAVDIGQIVVRSLYK